MKYVLISISILFFCQNKISAQCTCNRSRDSLALVALYDSLDGPNWKRKDNWKTSRPINEWYGVLTHTTPNEKGCVAVLDFDGDLNYSWSEDKGGNGLKGRIPAAFGNLNCLLRLSLNDNKNLTGVLPSSIGNLKALEVFWARNCSLTFPLPDAFWTLSNLEEIDFGINPLNAPLPSRLVELPKLSGFIAENSGLTGKIPIEWRNATQLNWLGFAYNALDSLPDLTTFPMSSCACATDSGLIVYNNRLTFDDILPNMKIKTKTDFIYAPQDSIFKDTTVNVTAGTPLSIDLKIDGALTTNNYRWFKNGKDTLSDGATNSNRLILNTIRPEQAGVYTCTITNPNAPLLTLYSRKIRVVVNQKPLLPTTTNEKAIGLTPNGDGQNDFLIFNEIENEPTIDADLNIVNRYGQMLFQARPYKNDWAGTNQQGERLPDGAYFYILKIGDATKTGDILIFSN